MTIVAAKCFIAYVAKGTVLYIAHYSRWKIFLVVGQL